MLQLITPELTNTGLSLLVSSFALLLIVAAKLFFGKRMSQDKFFSPKNEEELRSFLQEQGIPLDQWGQGQAKYVASLWKELEAGESKLTAAPLRRRVETVSLIIRRGEKMLIETEQQLSDGRTRTRHIPPSEKLQRGEHFLDATYRGLEEELSIPPDQAIVKLDTYRKRTVQQLSKSYPGLVTEYHIHTVEVDVPSLPHHRFSTLEPSLSTDTVAKAHIWDWLFPPSQYQTI